MTDELKKIRKSCLDIAFWGQDANLQSTFSSIELIWTLYHRIMKWDVNSARNPDRDLFILSKGQSTLALHAILAGFGLFSEEELMGYCSLNSRFSMQADRTKFCEGGIEISAGSLGHGFPLAVGMAFANKIQRSPSKVYVLAGDGEMNEGTMWEACAFAAEKKLDNLYLIIDDNHSIGSMVDLDSFQDKLQAFHFETMLSDGHNTADIEHAIMQMTAPHKPKALIAKTVRGYGSSTLMREKAWFHKAPNQEELRELKQEVDLFEKTDGYSCI